MTAAVRASKKVTKVQKAESPWAQARRRFFAGRQGPWGLGILGFIFFLVVVGPFFAPYHVGEIPKPSEFVFLGRGPSFEHIFGETAQLQLDVFMLVVNGGRASLFIGFAAAVGSITIGTLVGIIAGYFGGRLDSFLMRLVDVFLAIPSLFVIIVGAKILSALGGTGLQTVIIVFIVFGWMGTARLVRGQVLALREMEFIEAARTLGATDARIMWKHIVPNTLAPVIVSLAFGVPSAIIGEAGLSFIGLGVRPPTASWGHMLQDGLSSIYSQTTLIIAPALCVALLLLAFTFLGDGLRDALDPRMKQ